MRENEINAFLAKKSKAAIVLEALLNKEYITCLDIILMGNGKTPFTTCPQGLIETIRKNFGYDFVLDREVKFFRTMYNTKGEPYKQTDTYKQYFLNKMGLKESGEENAA